MGGYSTVGCRTPALKWMALATHGTLKPCQSLKHAYTLVQQVLATVHDSVKVQREPGKDEER